MQIHWTACLHEVGTLRVDGEDIARLDAEIAKLKAERAKMESEALKRARMDWSAEEIAAAKEEARHEMSMQKIRNDKRVELVDDERKIGNGVIVELKQGWTFDPCKDNRVRGEETAAEMLEALKLAQPYSGPFTS